MERNENMCKRKIRIEMEWQLKIVSELKLFCNMKFRFIIFILVNMCFVRRVNRISHLLTSFMVNGLTIVYFSSFIIALT